MKTNKNIVAIIFVLIIGFYHTSSIFAYDSKKVHPAINEHAIKGSILNSVLVNIGYSKGIEDYLDIDRNKAIYKYFREGGTKEDDASLFGEKRWLNHFHDPLQSWKKAGLKGVWFNYSSLAWASGAYWTDNDASWPVARASYYKALTKSTKADREQALADTFTQLEQVMHLLADSSVPAHVRNESLSL